MANYTELDFEEIPEWPLIPQVVMVVLMVLILQGAGYWFS